MAKEGKYDKKFLTVVEEKFSSLDRQKKGHVTLDDMLYQVNHLREIAKTNKEEVDRFHEAVTAFATGIGFAAGVKLTKEQFIDKVSKFAVADQQRKRNGEESLYFRMYHALFDAIDLNKDGTLSLDEVKVMMKVFHGNEDENAVKALFKMADTNKNGKIERDEFVNMKFSIMFNPENM